MALISPSGPSQTAALALAFFLGAYLIGGIPWALIVGKRVAGIDLRTVGSGNLGATNVGRALGKKWAVAVFALDFAKAALPVLVAGALTGGKTQEIMQVSAALGAILGHVYSPYIGFRGGKGIATTAGAAFAMNPLALIVGTVAFFVTAYLSARVSVGSLTIAALYPPVMIVLYPGRNVNLAFAVCVSLLIIWTHRANIGRLVRGEEPRVSWGMKRRTKSA